MEEVSMMFGWFKKKKNHVIRYYKPNIGSLRGPIGMSIMETLRNAHKPDLTAAKKECEANERRILAAIKNGTY